MNSIIMKTKNQKSGKWKKTQHERFMKAIEKYGKNWIQVQKYVKSRSLAQVRSHAQKILTHLTKEEKRILQMKDFERMVDFCKVKDLSHEEENTKKDQEEIFVKKEAKSEEQNQKELLQADLKQDSLIKIEHVNTAEMNHGSSIDNKFHYQNYQNLGFQTAVDNIYAMGNEWTCINPYPYFQFPFLVNPPVKQEMAYNGNINPFFFTNQ